MIILQIFQVIFRWIPLRFVKIHEYTMASRRCVTQKMSGLLNSQFLVCRDPNKIRAFNIIQGSIFILKGEGNMLIHPENIVGAVSTVSQDFQSIMFRQTCWSDVEIIGRHRDRKVMFMTGCINSLQSDIISCIILSSCIVSKLVYKKKKNVAIFFSGGTLNRYKRRLSTLIRGNICRHAGRTILNKVNLKKFRVNFEITVVLSFVMRLSICYTISIGY